MNYCKKKKIIRHEGHPQSNANVGISQNCLINFISSNEIKYESINIF